MITGVHHFALTVSDAERSIAFYRDLFGLEVAADREVQGDYVAVITGIPEVHSRLVHMRGYGIMLELLQYKNPLGATRSREFQDTGSAHCCFITDDIDADFARLVAAGVPIRSDAPVTTTSGPNRGGRGIYCLDPDGNAVEVVQVAPHLKEAAKVAADALAAAARTGAEAMAAAQAAHAARAAAQ